MTLFPMNDYVLLSKNKDVETTTASGLLHLPGNANQTAISARVVAVGPGRMLENGVVGAMTVKPGQTVLAPKTGMDLKFEGKDYVMLQEYQILGIISE